MTCFIGSKFSQSRFLHFENEERTLRLLVEYFIDRYSRKARKSIKRIGQETLELLQAYAWPGNIRELQNVIERSVILCETETFSIDESWLPHQPHPSLIGTERTELNSLKDSKSKRRK